MTTLIAANLLPLFLAFLIGIATGWWIWARYRSDADIQAFSADDYPVDAEPAVPEAIALEATAPLAAAALQAPAPVKRKAPAAAAPKPIMPRKPRARKAAPALTAIGIPAAIGKADDLLQIKGVGPKLNALLISLGVTRFDQIAAWKAKEISLVDSHLGSFSGRIVRDEWVDQAGLLSTGKIKTFEARFGKLDSENQ